MLLLNSESRQWLHKPIIRVNNLVPAEEQLCLKILPTDAWEALKQTCPSLEIRNWMRDWRRARTTAYVSHISFKSFQMKRFRKERAFVLDKVLTDCSALGAKTPKWSAVWRLIPDDMSHTFLDHCNARASPALVLRARMTGLGLIIRDHFPASVDRFRKVSECDI